MLNGFLLALALSVFFVAYGLLVSKELRDDIKRMRTDFKNEIGDYYRRFSFFKKPQKPVKRRAL